MSTCHALLFLSALESLGFPLIEAAEHSLPVIAPDKPYVRELLGSNFYPIVDNHCSVNPLDLLDSMNRFLILPKIYSRLISKPLPVSDFSMLLMSMVP